MKQREDAKPDGAPAFFAFSSAAVVCPDHFIGVRNPGAAQADRAREICSVVVRDVCVGWDCAGLADVSVFKVTSELVRSRRQAIASALGRNRFGGIAVFRCIALHKVDHHCVQAVPRFNSHTGASDVANNHVNPASGWP